MVLRFNSTPGTTEKSGGSPNKTWTTNIFAEHAPSPTNMLRSDVAEAMTVLFLPPAKNFANAAKPAATQAAYKYAQNVMLWYPPG